MTSKELGLISKYYVDRVNGKPLGNCIVLEFKDFRARVGIKAFSETVRKDGYILLADDLDKELTKYE